jgi:hypothetical protein
VVECAGTIAGTGRPKSLGPAGQVVDGIGQDPEGVGRHQVLEPCEVVVVVVAVLQGREQGQPGGGRGCHRRLADALAQGDGLLGAVAYRDQIAGQVLAEAEPLQAVDDCGHRTGLSRSRQRVAVEVLLRPVVA